MYLGCPGQPFPFNAIQGAPKRLRHALGGLQRLFPAPVSGDAQLLFELVTPHAGVVDIGGLMNGEVGAGSGIGAIKVLETARFFPGDARHLGLISIKRRQCLRG